MSDIVTRLHGVSGCTQKTFLHRIDWDDGQKVINDAIAEIENLRFELKAARNEIEIADGEIERLKALAAPPTSQGGGK